MNSSVISHDLREIKNVTLQKKHKTYFGDTVAFSVDYIPRVNGISASPQRQYFPIGGIFVY